MLAPIKRIKLTDSIVERVKDLIAEGSLKPGDRLPPERELSQQLGVSRLSLREALKVLSALQLVEVRQGEGTFIHRPTAQSLVDPLLESRLLEQATLLELLEVRRCVEVEIAGLAARRASAEDIDAMRTHLETLRADVATDAPQPSPTFLASDHAFHLAIAEAAGNKVLHAIIEGITDLLNESRRRSTTVPGAAGRAALAHQAILDAIAAGDEGSARAAMRRHLNEVEEDLRAAWGSSGGGGPA